MSFFTNTMQRLGRVRVILDRKLNKPYMIRYYLFLRDRSKFPFNITLHKILLSDDPVFHNHPWSWYATIILKGGYFETLPVYDADGNVISDNTVWRGPGYFTFRKGAAVHYLTLKEDTPCTTLFFMGKQSNSWGFLVDKKTWVHWLDYIKR